MKRELETLRIKAGHLLDTHSHRGPNWGFGIKAQSGIMGFPYFDAFEAPVHYSTRTFGPETPLYDEVARYHITAFNSYRLIGTQLLIPDFKPLYDNVRKKEVKHVEREIKGGLFRKDRKVIVPEERVVYRKVKLKACDILYTDKKEPIYKVCLRFWPKGYPEFDEDTRSHDRGVLSCYTVLAAQSDAEALWDAAKQNPDIVLELGKAVFPTAFEIILKETPLRKPCFVETVEDLKRALSFCKTLYDL